MASACLGLVLGFALATPASAITAWGELGTEPGRLDTPVALATRGGFVYVADFGNDRIQKYTADGAYISQWGSFGAAPGQLDGPAGIALDKDGAVYVTDFRNHRVQKFDANGRLIAAWGTPGDGPGSFSGPAGIAIDGEGRVLVADLDHGRVQKFTAAGEFLAAWDGAALGGLDAPWSVAAADRAVFVLDRARHRVLRLDDAGRAVSSLLDAVVIASPWGIAVSPAGDVFVSDEAAGRIERFGADGTHGEAWSASDAAPAAIAVHGGDLFVADARRHRVMRIEGVAAAATSATRRFERFVLQLAGPNPSARGTTLRFGLPAAGTVRAGIFDIHGRRVRELVNARLEAGEHRIAWDGRDAAGQRTAAGIYFASARYEDGAHTVVERHRVVVLP